MPFLLQLIGFITNMEVMEGGSECVELVVVEGGSECVKLVVMVVEVSVSSWWW